MRFVERNLSRLAVAEIKHVGGARTNTTRGARPPPQYSRQMRYSLRSRDLRQFGTKMIRQAGDDPREDPQSVAGSPPKAGQPLIDNCDQPNLMALGNELRRHLVGDHCAKRMPAEIKR